MIIFSHGSPFSNIALAHLSSMGVDSSLSFCSHQQLGAVAAGMQRTGLRLSLAGWVCWNIAGASFLCASVTVRYISQATS